MVRSHPPPWRSSTRFPCGKVGAGIQIPFEEPPNPSGITISTVTVPLYRGSVRPDYKSTVEGGWLATQFRSEAN